MASSGIELTVVVPTFNERGNICEVVRRLESSLEGIRWEVVFVDDASPDGTSEVVRTLARTDPRVRLILRHNRRGLSSAVVEGALAGAGDVIAVMDGDLQHDENVLPALYRRVASGEAEIATASRFLTADGASGLSSDTRHKISNSGIWLANRLFGLDLTDPLTGFFAVRRSAFERALPSLSELGFKILLDLITSIQPAPRTVEVPFKFRERLHGASKLDGRVIFDFFLFFLEKKVSRVVLLPARFLSFAFINSVGILVHLSVLYPLVSLIGTGFATAQLMATFVAMVFNYTVNNAITYHDRKLTGARFYWGFAVFAAICSVGIVGNVGAATILHERYLDASYLAPALAGALITVLWNYVATRAFVWGWVKAPRLALQRRRAEAVAEWQSGPRDSTAGG